MTTKAGIRQTSRSTAAEEASEAANDNKVAVL